MASHINRVVLTGNLTRDPELRETRSAAAVCVMRVASNARVKRGDQWEEKANFFDVVCFGSQAENVVKFLAKGRPVAIDGRIDYQEWEQDGQKRNRVQIIADNVQFLSDGQRDGDRGHSPAVGGSADQPPVSVAAQDDADDIPF